MGPRRGQGGASAEDVGSHQRAKIITRMLEQVGGKFPLGPLRWWRDALGAIEVPLGLNNWVKIGRGLKRQGKDQIGKLQEEMA